jgi:hypothetical protein
MATKIIALIVSVGVGLGLGACVNVAPSEGGGRAGREGLGAGQNEVKETDVDIREGDITSFTCVTKLSEHRDPCLEGGCCGFPRGGAGECWERARCGYGSIAEADSDEISGAVCSCFWCDRYRVSCTADYETGQVECLCTDSSL